MTRRRQGYAGRAESPLERRLRLRTPWTAFAVVIELTWTLDIPCGLSDIRLFKVAALGRLIECTGISKWIAGILPALKSHQVEDPGHRVRREWWRSLKKLRPPWPPN